MEADEYDIVTDALMAGDKRRLDSLAATVLGFPHGRDDFLGRSWIINAIDVGSVDAVAWMLNERVILDFPTADGRTPLHAALDRDVDRLEVVELLLRAGAPVNEIGWNGWTPAHMAAAYDDVEALRLLVSYGADLTIRTPIDDYTTPLEEARSLGKERAAAYLETVV